MDIRDASTGDPGLDGKATDGWPHQGAAENGGTRGLAVLAACTSTESQMETGAATLPRPQVVIVDTFATSASEVTLDQGLSTEVEEAIKADRAPRAPSRKCRRAARSPTRSRTSWWSRSGTWACAPSVAAPCRPACRTRR